jgi:hypothetical protein
MLQNFISAENVLDYFHQPLFDKVPRKTRDINVSEYQGQYIILVLRHVQARLGHHNKPRQFGRN